MADFVPIRPFDIDHGQLDGLTPQQIFVLGYELSRIDELIHAGAVIDCMIHSENMARVEAELERHGRNFAFIWPKDDPSEAWVQVGSPVPKG